MAKTYAPNEQLPESVAAPIQAQIKAIQSGISQLSAQQSGGSAVSAKGQLVDSSGNVVGMANPADRYSPSARQAEGPEINPIATPQIDTTQPSPQTAKVIPPTQQALVPFDQATKSLEASGLTGQTLTSAKASLENAYRQAHALTTQTGQTPPPSMGAGLGVTGATMQGLVPQTEPQSIIGQVQEVDKNFDSLFVEFDKYFAPQEQKKSLLQEYEALSGKLGLDKINQELIDTKRIIDGTEDDVRSEITAAGGFATDSQVLAMTNARNKQLIKNYNYLLDTKSAATTQLSTMMQLSVQDRQFAEAEFDRKLNFAFKVAEFKQRAQDNARQTYMTLGQQMGWDSLLTSTSPYEQGVISKTLGLGAGQLQQLAAKSAQDRQLALQDRQLERAIKGQQLTNLQLEGQKKLMGLQPEQVTPAGELQLAQVKSNIDQISSLAKSGALKSAVGPVGIARGGIRLPFGIATIPTTLKGFTGERQEFIAGIEQLRSQLNLDTLIKAKAQGATFGALSDQELRVLASAATKLGTFAKTDKRGNILGYNANEKSFRQELDKINNFAKLDFILKGGDPASVGIQVMPDGTYWTRNSDGSMSQLR